MNNIRDFQIKDRDQSEGLEFMSKKENRSTYGRKRGLISYSSDSRIFLLTQIYIKQEGKRIVHIYTHFYHNHNIH